MLKPESKQAVSNFFAAAETEFNAFLKARSPEEYEAAAQLILDSQPRAAVSTSPASASAAMCPPTPPPCSPPPATPPTTSTAPSRPRLLRAAGGRGRGHRHLQFR